LPVFFAAEAIDAVYQTSLTASDGARAMTAPLNVGPVMRPAM
jgi:hypothetical protein